MIFLNELEKEKVCACIQFQINRLNKKIDKLETPNGKKMTDEEYNELYNDTKAIDFYTNIISRIRQG